MSVGAIAEKVSLSQSALSQHLAKLRSLNLVETRRDRQMIYYSCKSERGAPAAADARGHFRRTEPERVRSPDASRSIVGGRRADRSTQRICALRERDDLRRSQPA